MWLRNYLILYEKNYVEMDIFNIKIIKAVLIHHEIFMVNLIFAFIELKVPLDPSG